MEMSKKEWLDYLFYRVGEQKYDFYLCGLKKEGDETKHTKWKKYSEIVSTIDLNEEYKIEYINQRQILPNEIVLDIEEKDNIKEIVKEVSKHFKKFYIFDTGSNGYHIHIFFDDKVPEKLKLSIIKHFKADTQKASKKTLIALENCPHWKTGKVKKRVDLNED